jgi:hypothetical protein
MATKATIEMKYGGKVIGYKSLVVAENVSHSRIESMASRAFGPGSCGESGPSDWEPGQYDVGLDGKKTKIE